LIRPDHLGDLLFTTPALRMLRQELPEARITLAVGPWNRELAHAFPWVDEVLEVDFPWFNRRPNPSALAPYVQLLDEARHWRTFAFDTAVSLRFDFWWGALLAARAGIPRRIGYALPEVAPLLTSSIPYEPGHQEVEQNWRLLQQGLGLSETQTGPLKFPIPDEDQVWAKETLPNRRTAMLLVGTGAPVKQWPAESFAEVGDHLASKYGLQLLVAGGAADASRIEAVQSALSEPAMPLVNASLGRLAAALSRCSLAVGVDSGPMHLAVAVGTPTLHLYGPVSAAAFGPWGDPQRHRAIVSPLACVPCNRLDYSEAELPFHPCIREMPTYWVKQECAALLQEAVGAHRH
jgi:heptosyltransferase-2/heptosyltransferase-3